MNPADICLALRDNNESFTFYREARMNHGRTDETVS